MSPQFVDFDADGQLDIVAGTFDGSPHVAFGSKDGYAQPVQILDSAGARIVLNRFWNFDEKKWDETKRCDLEGSSPPQGHGTSAIAFDWDGDGDFDLLLGDYGTGRIYLRTNEGKPGHPSFTLKNQPVLDGKTPLVVPDNVATLRAIDWDEDGLLDLLVGSVGYSNGGGVYLYRNAGRAGAPVFGARQALVAPQHDAVTEPTRPDLGLYPDAADVDGDGDLDLLVGGQSKWMAEARKLTEAETARLPVLREEIAKVDASLKETNDHIEAQLAGLDDEAAEKKREELQAKFKVVLAPLSKKRGELEYELGKLTPGSKLGYFVWFYRNEAR